ncbi:MAG: Crp/Fnr family transcriptional regulator [Gemmatimonadetes bacterium]|nr:Crp/Fnr family transcriptional regulator [Gemmatimonadota bacterium]
MSDPANLDTLPLFASLSAETRRQLVARAVERTFPVGAVLFHAGTEPTGIYVVLSGCVRIVRSRDGRRYVVHTEGPGGTLAELPFFEGGRLPATAVAAEPSRCLILPREALRAAMRDDPAVAWLFLRRLSSRVRELVERLDRASTQGIPARLAAFLLTREESAQGGPFTLGLTQAELAEELGTVREVVVRGLGRLRNSGIMGSAGRGRYVIRDATALRALAER